MPTRASRRDRAVRFAPAHGPIIQRDEANPRDTAPFPECAEFVRVKHGTKGGRPRDVPLTTDAQRELLARVTAAVPSGMFVGRPDHTSAQSATRFYYVIRRFGVSKDQLGVVAHGLRHQKGQRRVSRRLRLSFARARRHSRHLGDSRARERAARLLGHSRQRATTSYIGAQARGAEGGSRTRPRSLRRETRREARAEQRRGNGLPRGQAPHLRTRDPPAPESGSHGNQPHVRRAGPRPPVRRVDAVDCGQVLR
jgi:hypothetical protein